MSHSFKEQTFKGKPVSELNAVEQNQYRRACQKELKRSIKFHNKGIQFHEIVREGHRCPCKAGDESTADFINRVINRKNGG